MVLVFECTKNGENSVKYELVPKFELTENIDIRVWSVEVRAFECISNENSHDKYVILFHILQSFVGIQYIEHLNLKNIKQSNTLVVMQWHWKPTYRHILMKTNNTSGQILGENYILIT